MLLLTHAWLINSWVSIFQISHDINLSVAPFLHWKPDYCAWILGIRFLRQTLSFYSMNAIGHILSLILQGVRESPSVKTLGCYTHAHTHKHTNTHGIIKQRQCSILHRTTSHDLWFYFFGGYKPKYLNTLLHQNSYWDVNQMYLKNPLTSFFGWDKRQMPSKDSVSCCQGALCFV